MSYILQYCIGLQRLRYDFSFRAVANTNVTLKISPEEEIRLSSDSTKPFRTPPAYRNLLCKDPAGPDSIEAQSQGPKTLSSHLRRHWA